MEHHVSGCEVRVLCSRWCFLVAILFLSSHVSAQSSPAARLSVVYTQTPSNVTSRTNATFGFTVVDANGTSACAVAPSCSFTCQLDQLPGLNCSTGQASFASLSDGVHNFSVAVNSSSGAAGASEFSWTIDTVAPTAVVNAAQAFTNAQNVTVNITFSETCEHDGGFVCTNSSFCDLWVFGAGAVIPSSLKELEKGRSYSLDVALSTAVSTGKVDAVIARSSCADAAGNLLRRTNQSTSAIRFDRTVPKVNLWTAVPSSEVIIDNQPRTCEATNKATDLRIYLDFDSPVTSSAQELLGFLSVSSGSLSATARKSFSNRRFGFMLSNVTNVSEVTVAFKAGNAVSNRYGTPVPSNSSRTFLYDTLRPQVQVSTSARAKTKDTAVPFVVQFTESVFGFNSSSVMISGGSLRSFTGIDRSTYSLEVTATNNNLVTVTVLENSTLDVAGNPNSGSSSAQTRHYNVPSISVVLYSLITVGLLSTALVSGMLSVSSATLAAVGAISGKRVGDPSRNLLGLTCHLQVLALSGFLAVSLPVEYQEVTNGLRWLIPHVRTPWQSKSATNTNTSSSMTNASTVLQNVIGGRRRLLAVEEQLGVQHSTHRGRALGANATLHGLPLGPGDYQLYFLNQVSDQGALKSVVNGNGYNGWQEFQRNMFWIGVVGGGLILIHILMVFFQRWRTRAPIKGALTIPRFELYLLILVIPGLCQASAFAIRGETPVGIAVGGLLLAVPTAFLVSILVFLIYGVFMGALVQYREFRYEVRRHGYAQPQKAHGLINLVAGTGFPGKWVRSVRLDPSFLPRYGIIFEDQKGPPTILVHKKPQSLRHSIKRSGSTTTENGYSEEGSNDVVQVSDAHRLLGDARAAYILVDLSRRITLSLVFGFFPESDHSWSQVGVVVGVTAVQLVYLVAVKPFRRRGVQVVETIALLCELGVFVAALALLAKGNPTDLNHGVGIFMLALLVLSFVAQLVNEWYALLEQLTRLSTAQEPTLNDGLKRLAGGLVLPFTPRRMWGKFIGPQAPQRAPSSVAASTRKSISPPYESKPLPLPNPDSVISSSNLTPNLTHNPPVAQIIAIDVDSGPLTSASMEIQPEPSPRSDRQNGRSIQRVNIFSAEGRRSRGGSHRETDSQELKILRELARASFSRHPRDTEHDIEQGGAGTSTTSGVQIPSSPVISPREGHDGNRYMRKRRQFPGTPHGPARSSPSSNTESADSISAATPEIGDSALHDVPLSVPELAHLVSPPTMSTSSSNKLRPGNVDSHSMNVRDASLAAIRPLEER